MFSGLFYFLKLFYGDFEKTKQFSCTHITLVLDKSFESPSNGYLILQPEIQGINTWSRKLA